MKETILIKIQDLVIDFVYYDRKECEDLSRDDLMNSVESGKVTIDEMVAEFRKHLEGSFT